MTSTPPILPALQAIASLIIPLFVGLVTGIFAVTLRKRTLQSRRSAFLVLFVLPSILALVTAIIIQRLGFWDRLTLSFLFALGLFLGGHQWVREIEKKNIALAIGTSLLALLLTEQFARFLAPPPLFPPASDTGFLSNKLPFVDHGSHSYQVQADALYPDLNQELLQQRTASSKTRKETVLHIGDSMIWAIGVKPKSTFPGVLETLSPETAHVNASAPGLGPDGYYVIAHNWLKKVDPDLVVVHIFSGNDQLFDAPVPFCNWESLVDYSNVTPTIRCSEPTWIKPPFYERLVGGPAPFFIRIATDYSLLARHIRVQFLRLTGNSLLLDSQAAYRKLSMPERFRRMRMLLASLKEQLDAKGIPLVINLLPYRYQLEYELLEPRLPMDEFVKGKEVIVFSLDQIPPFDKAVSTMSKELGIPLFDAHDLILNGMRNSGDEHWYIPIPPGDHHYSEAGHKEIAIWLHKKLGTILE